MPSITFTRVQVSGEFETSAEACDAIRTVLGAAGFSTTPPPPAALPALAATLPALPAPAREVVIPPAAAPPKAAAAKRAPKAKPGPAKAKAKPAASAVVEEPRTVKGFILRVLEQRTEQGGIKLGEVLEAVIAAGKETTESSVYSILRTMVNEKLVDYDSLDRVYCLREKPNADAR